MNYYGVVRKLFGDDLKSLSTPACGSYLQRYLLVFPDGDARVLIVNLDGRQPCAAAKDVAVRILRKLVTVSTARAPTSDVAFSLFIARWFSAFLTV